MSHGSYIINHCQRFLKIMYDKSNSTVEANHLAGSFIISKFALNKLDVFFYMFSLKLFAFSGED